MAKNPVCPIYYNDLLGSTRTWTDEEFGCYVRLLLEQWDKGLIPNPYQTSTKTLPNALPDFHRISRISSTAEKHWGLIGSKFGAVEGGLQNDNMEEIREKRKKYSESQTSNVRKRYQTSTETPTSEIEIEKEIEKVNKEKDFIESFNKITGKKCRLGDKVKGKLNARLDSGYILDDIKTAIQNCFNTQYHKDNPHYLTPEFILREDKLEMYLNKNGKKAPVEQTYSENPRNDL